MLKFRIRMGKPMFSMFKNTIQTIFLLKCLELCDSIYSSTFLKMRKSIQPKLMIVGCQCVLSALSEDLEKFNGCDSS